MINNPYGYGTNEYWQFEAEKRGFKSAKEWLLYEEQLNKYNDPPDDYNVTETHDDWD